LRTHETVHRLAVLERNHGRNGLNAHLPGNLRVIVNVHLGQFDGAAGCLHRLFDDRRKLLARPAPGRPEIDKDRLLAGGLQNVRHEGLRSDIENEIAAGRTVAAAAIATETAALTAIAAAHAVSETAANLAADAVIAVTHLPASSFPASAIRPPDTLMG